MTYITYDVKSILDPREFGGMRGRLGRLQTHFLQTVAIDHNLEVKAPVAGDAGLPERPDGQKPRNWTSAVKIAVPTSPSSRRIARNNTESSKKAHESRLYDDSVL